VSTPAGSIESDSHGPRNRRRWLLGLEPILEGGWLHKGQRASGWRVERELVALALFGDVSVDLVHAKSVPADVELKAYAIGRDVDVLVPAGTQVDLTGRAHNDHLANEVPPLALEQRARRVRISAHTLLGNVTVRQAP
jgi:hypothetical protein